MKRITLHADGNLIERARSMARTRGTTLNAAFREWLAQFEAVAGDAPSFETVMKRLQHVDSGRPFRRDEMNER